ncbi:pseudouridine synthase [Anditalea andensis]|uniref:Pseudouridine synthase n=1 Tax=Anditalea andensis TaxID=1048983 RepID=A0A074KQF3_9BACT|nr:pseudouridine synthase [Anditalea andensis]KEO72171.1 pseudouridine synthase [Anditalea andensis]
MPHYFVIYKPYGILSQFSGDDHTLRDIGDFPVEVYPVGRLDKDSEGLLLLTDDKSLNHHLLNPLFGHERTYLAQVEGIPEKEALHLLAAGVKITVDGKSYLTKKATVSLPENVTLPPRNPPIRYRKNVPDTWIKLSLIEGKNRQVRKMTAAAGYPTLRLVRWSMEDLTIEGFEVGEVRSYSREEIYSLLRIEPGKFKLGEAKSPHFPNRNKNRR